jgi:DNA-binding MarR family transcriptional regulator
LTRLDEKLTTIARECVAVRVRLINRAISRIYDVALRPFGLTIAQMNILVAVSRLRNARPSAVSERLCMDRSTLSRDLDKMLDRGWLNAVEDDDGRAYRLAIAQKGRKLLDRAAPAWKRAQRDTHELLGAEGVAAISKMADKLGFGSRNKP